MGVTFYFSSPENDAASWDQFKIKRGTSPTGPFNLIATINAKDATGKWVTSYFDLSGLTTNYYTVTPYDSASAVSGLESDAVAASTVFGYLSVKEARMMGKFQPSEYDDETLQLFISQVTADIDQRIGRTWQGVQTVTDEYYNGNGYNYLQLNHCDILSVDALSVSINNNGTFTTVTPSKVTWYKDGAVILDVNMHSDIEAKAFPLGNQNVKVSYTWGFAEPTASIKELALLLLYSKMKIDDAIEDQITKKVERLKNKGVHMV